MTSTRPLRVAVYGFVDHDSGSVAFGNHLVLEEMLRRGHRIDFYAAHGFMNPTRLIGRPGFEHVPVSIPAVERVWRGIEAVPPGKIRTASSLAYSQLSNAMFERAIESRVNAAHQDEGYDFFLAMGALSPIRTPGLLNVAWPQGPPDTEWEAIRSEKARVLALAGRGQYLMLKIGYAYKKLLNDAQVGHSQLVLCGGEWSRRKWIEYGLPEDAVAALPYPYDLDRFRPDGPPGRSPTVTFLCLGRIVPRKRVDLLIDAMKIVRAERPEARALIVGRFAYAKGFEALLGGIGPDDGIEYRAFVDRSEVPALLSRIDAVIQPSEAENLGSSIVEGLAAGRPAIVGPTNGTADYLGEGSIVFEEYTPRSVASAMIRMVDAVRSDPERLAAASREAAETHVRPDRVVDRLLGIVERAKRIRDYLK